MNNETNPQEKRKGLKFWHLVLLFICLTLAVFLVERNSGDFLASVIPTKIAAPFDGTTMPIQKVPKWTALTSDQYKAPYESIPADKLVSLPKYDPSQLKTPNDSLGWKTDNDLNIRNAKITYSTVYMGDYKLDGIEYAGDHPAVDIKIPDDTPVYAIANGVVTEAISQTTGYGKHVVVRHDNVPSPNNPSVKVTLYSSYNHMSEIDVQEGDVVTKGQLVGKSGHTGTATTPHVHFQIDTADAPFHPYWPFTYAESNAAGLSFFDAVNAGLNADKAKAVTINPMLYVQEYLNYSGSSAGTTATTTSTTSSSSQPAVTNPTTPTTPTTDSQPAVTQAVNPVQPAATQETPVVPDNTGVTDNATQAQAADTTTYASNAAKFVLESDGSFVENVPEKITIRAVDVNGDTVTNYKPKNDVNLQVELGGADLPAYLTADDFVDGEATFTATPHGQVSLQIKASDGVLEGESQPIQASTFSDVSESSAHYKAISFLQKHGVITGYPDGTFKPDNVVSRVEALKFVLAGANSSLITDVKLPFKDTKASEWYTDYVATGYSKGIVAGYPDSTFKPADTVNRVEFLKMLVNGMEVTINPVATRDPYADVPKDAWYAPFVRYAKEKNIMDAAGQDFKPEDGMTRGDVAEALYRLIMLKVNNADVYSSNMTASSSAITKYFS